MAFSFLAWILMSLQIHWLKKDFFASTTFMISFAMNFLQMEVQKSFIQETFANETLFSKSVVRFIDAFQYSFFPPNCSQGQVCNPPIPSHSASASSFLPSSYFSSKKIYVFTSKVQERNRMWKLCASARDPWRQHHPHLWHPLLQPPLQVIFLLTM